ncbi:MAG TPA: DoxX family protein [Parasegetibacter sp.]
MKLNNTRYPAWSFNLALFLMRLAFGGLMLINHGFEKLMRYSELQYKFSDPFGFGPKWSLILVIFAEVFCSILVIIGLFTRFALIPLIITMLTVLFYVKNGDLKGGEMSALFLSGFLAILLVGPGKASVDGMMGK